MPGGWKTSTRRQGLPKDWPARVRAVRKRSGGQCEHVEAGVRCTGGADGGVDHHVSPGEHGVWALRDLCHEHHARKTQREAAAARRAVSKYREPERHPGLM